LNKPNPPAEPATDVKGGVYVLRSRGKNYWRSSRFRPTR
jgi:hypothetical protein